MLLEHGLKSVLGRSLIDGSTYKLLRTVKLRPDADSAAYDPSSRCLYITRSQLGVLRAPSSSFKKVAQFQVEVD